VRVRRRKVDTGAAADDLTNRAAAAIATASRVGAVGLAKAGTALLTARAPDADRPAARRPGSGRGPVGEDPGADGGQAEHGGDKTPARPPGRKLAGQVIESVAIHNKAPSARWPVD
jgi:hypothetical protein